MFSTKGTKAESGAAALDGWDNLAEVVADEAKTNVFCKLFNNCQHNKGYIK